MISSSDVVLFQGDSITDALRDRDEQTSHEPAALGQGYARYAAAMLLAAHPGVTVFNRGLSGNRIGNLRDRWQADCLDLRPSVVSILIGVNDTWQGPARGAPEQGTPLDQFDAIYRTLLEDTKAALPGVKLVLCQPFVTETGAVKELGFHPDIDRRRELADAIAADHADVYVRFQDVFDTAVNRARPDYWAGDGVHPTVAGHMLMARAWLARVQGG